jgi:kinesin family protein 2/24
LVCKDILKRKKDLSLTVCFVEIYGGRTYDLFNDREKIAILEDGNGNAQISGQNEYEIENLNELLDLIRLGIEARTTGSTEANSQSSRSHAILQISLRREDGQLFSKFSLVDLAGSERGADTGNISKDARREGSEINKSLLALKECIRALHLQRSKKDSSKHIPFRASKLTHLLRDSFVGKNSRLAMISMVSPGAMSVEHSLNTFRYAYRMKEFEELDTKSFIEHIDPLEATSQLEYEHDLDHEGILNQEFANSHLDDDDLEMNSLLKGSDGYEAEELSRFDDELEENLASANSNDIGHSEAVVDLQDEKDDVIDLHISTVNYATKLTRKERIILSNATNENHEIKDYLDESMNIIEERIRIWTELRDKMMHLKYRVEK